MMRIQLQSLLKTLNRILHTVLARSDDAEIVPGVGESIWIVGWQFDGVLESFARSRVFGLVQVDTSDAVGGFGAGWIVTQGLPERRFSLIKISALERERHKRGSCGRIRVHRLHLGKAMPAPVSASRFAEYSGSRLQRGRGRLGLD